VDKVFRSKLYLKHPHFSEGKMGYAESAAQPSDVQAGRRPPRERREAALTGRGGRRGTGQGVALSLSSCGLGRAKTEGETFFSYTRQIRDRHSPEAPGQEHSFRASWRIQDAPSSSEYADRGHCLSVEAGPKKAGFVPQNVVSKRPRRAETMQFVAESSPGFLSHWPSGSRNNIHAQRRGVPDFPASSPSQAPGPISQKPLSWHGEPAASWEFMHPPSLQAVCPNGTKTNTGEHTCLTSMQRRSQETSARTQKP
jgi:hypothetical protein